MTKPNIDNPNHPHHIPAVPVGTTLTMQDAEFVKGAKMAHDGHLSFTAQGISRIQENADGSCVDRVIIDRTYTPNPKK